jgi:hypothetical protein
MRRDWKTFGRLAAGAVVLLVVVMGAGCGGNDRAAIATETVGAWLSADGSSLLLLQANGSYQTFDLGGNWAQGDLTMANGTFTLHATEARDAADVGVTTTGTYTIAGDDLVMHPAGGAVTDRSRLPAGGPVPAALVGTWTGYGQHLVLYATGYYYFYDVTDLTLGTCTLAGGSYSLRCYGADPAGLVGQVTTGAYTVSGDTLNWTPTGQATKVLTRQK